MDIVRNDDGTLVVPVPQDRQREADDGAATLSDGADDEATMTDMSSTTRVLHPGEGGYDEALASGTFNRTPTERRPYRPRVAVRKR